MKIQFAWFTQESEGRASWGRLAGIYLDLLLRDVYYL